MAAGPTLAQGTRRAREVNPPPYTPPLQSHTCKGSPFDSSGVPLCIRITVNVVGSVNKENKPTVVRVVQISTASELQIYVQYALN